MLANIPRITRRSFHFYLALLLLLLSTLASVTAYARILRREKATAVSEIVLYPGQYRYILSSHSTCFGTLSLAFVKEEDTLSLRVDGKLALKENEAPITATILGQADFNSLSQLGASFLKIKSEDVEITIGTLNISPIRLSVNLKRADLEPFRWETSVPGPLELRKGKDLGYYLYYPHTAQLPRIGAHEILLPLTGQLGLTITSSSDSKHECGSGSLDLTATIGLIQGVLANLNPTFLR